MTGSSPYLPCFLIDASAEKWHIWTIQTSSETLSGIEKKRALTVNGPREQLPSKVDHLVDTDLDPSSGECSYFYNYLQYTFECMGTQITARSYMDDASIVSILQCPDDIDIEKELSGILAYLRLRYPTVKRLVQSGYTDI